MHVHQTDYDWETLGQVEPYWAVLTNEQFHQANLDEEAKRDFFATGARYVDWVFAAVRRFVDDQFKPARALDFGCGVARVVVALAQRCDEVVGVDVATSMLREARANCSNHRLTNVTLLKSDDQLSRVVGQFDLVNSFIVLQHVPSARGQPIFRRLVELVKDGGVGVLHLTYAKSAAAEEDTSRSTGEGPRVAPTPCHGIRYHLRGLRRSIWRRLTQLIARRKGDARGEHADVPVMQMNSYALNPLFHCLQQAGVRRMHLEFTDHSAEYGAVLLFRKEPGAPYQV